jgi:phosphate-selective porin OprO/OprP
MHGRSLDGLAWTLAAVIGCLSSAVAWGQQEMYPRLPADPAYTTAADLPSTTPQVPAAENGLISGSAFNAAEKDLAADVAALKAEIKKMKDQQEADKKKAAGAPSVKVGGRIHFDYAAFDQNANSIQQAGDMLNGTEFRRARLQAQGEAFYVVDYKIAFDFAGSGQAAFKDVYFTVKELPWLGNVRVGHFFECWGLEQQTSTNYITFMERSLIAQSGGTGGIGDRKSGIMAFNWNEAETATWAIGAFAWQVGERPPLWPSGQYDDAGGTAFDMRFTYLPWYDEAAEGRGLLHTGISYTYREVAELKPNQTGRYRITAKPEANLATAVADTGATGMEDAARISAFCPELAFV